MIRTNFQVFTAIFCLATLGPSGPAFSQSPALAPKNGVDIDGTTVVVMGKKIRKDRSAITMGIQSASECGFARGYSAADDEITQSYMDEFHGDDHSSNYDSGADETDPLTAGGRFRDTSPYGNASQSRGSGGDPSEAQNNSRFTSETPGGCTSADIAFAAGRNYILRKDHSLKDAYAAFDEKKYTEALNLFEKSYNKIGYEQAAFMAGKMHLAGLGTKRDTGEAILWLKKVAEARFAPGDEQSFDPADPYFMSTRSDATMTLAKIYMTGWDVPKNPREARKWYAKADSIGYTPATYILGQIYQKGYAGHADMAKATVYYNKAGKDGFTPAQYALGMMYYSGDDGVKKDDKLGAQWLMAAASGGHADALFTVGQMYDQGDTLPQDSQKALAYYKASALKDQPEAQYALGTYFYSGDVVKKDLSAARQWFARAAVNGNADAMYNMAAMLAHGEGGDKDVALAYTWFRLASMSGLAKATPAAKSVETKLSKDELAKAEALLNPPTSS